MTTPDPSTMTVKPDDLPKQTRTSKWDPLIDSILDIEDEGWFRIGSSFADRKEATKVRTAIANRLKARGYGSAFKIKSLALEDGGAGIWIALADEEEETEGEELT